MLRLYENLYSLCNANAADFPPAQNAHGLLLCSLKRWPHDTIRSPLPGKAFLQNAKLGEEDIIVYVGSFKPALALGGIEGPPRVQNPPVVEDDALALVQTVLEQVLVGTQELLVGVRGSEVVPQRGRRGADAGFKGALEGGRPVYAVEGKVGGLGVLGVGVEFYGGTGVVVVMCGVVVMVSHGKVTQSLEVCLGGIVQLLSGVEGVAEEGLSTGGAGTQRVQQLEVGWVRGVEEVHVQTKELRGVGNVLGLGLGADVPGAAVEGVLECTYAGCNVHH